MLHRTQIQLTDEQLRAVRRVARSRGVSAAEVIRRAIDEAIGREGDPATLWSGAAALVGAFADPGRTDGAMDHDRDLEEAFGGQPPRSSASDPDFTLTGRARSTLG